MDSHDNRRIYAKLIAQAWTDDAFKAQFLNDPTQTARDFGMNLPPDATVVVVDSGPPFSVDNSGPHPKLLVILPPRPEGLDEHALMGHIMKFIPGSVSDLSKKA